MGFNSGFKGLTTKSDTATYWKKSGAAGFSKVSVSELFNLLERAVEYKVHAFRIYVHKVDDSDFTTFRKKTGKVIMEKRKIAYLASLKCEESNHYSSNCLPYQRCWLLCTSYGEYRAARTCEDLQRGLPPGFYLFYSEKNCVSIEYSFTKCNTLLHCKPTFSNVMLMVQRWKQCGPFMAP